MSAHSAREIALLLVEQPAAGACGERHDRDLRIDADRPGKYARIGDEEPGHVPALAVWVDHRRALVDAHAAGTHRVHGEALDLVLRDRVRVELLDLVRRFE